MLRDDGQTVAIVYGGALMVGTLTTYANKPYAF